jgi:hypothetical protein
MKARTTEICIQAKKNLVTPNFQGHRFSNSQGMIHLIWPPKFIFDPIKPQQPTIQLFFTWNMLLCIKSRNGAQKEGPLPWFGVIPIAKCGLILAPWSGQLIQPKFFFQPFHCLDISSFQKGVKFWVPWRPGSHNQVIWWAQGPQVLI